MTNEEINKFEKLPSIPQGCKEGIHDFGSEYDPKINCKVCGISIFEAVKNKKD